MKIAIISDSHDNLPNIYKAIEWMNKNGVQEIIHCGDVCAPAALREMAKNFNGKIHLAYGNVDGDHERMERIASEVKNVIIYGDEGEMKIASGSLSGDSDGTQISIKQENKKTKKQGELRDFKVAFCHFPREARKLAESGTYDFVFYGHTHKPWEEMVGKCKLLNPGTLAGMFYKATFATLDINTGKIELILLERI